MSPAAYTRSGPKRTSMIRTAGAVRIWHALASPTGTHLSGGRSRPSGLEQWAFSPFAVEPNGRDPRARSPAGSPSCASGTTVSPVALSDHGLTGLGENSGPSIVFRPLTDGSVSHHMQVMIIFKPNPHTLRVTPSAKEPGRFDWSIMRDGVIVRQSVRSFGSEGASEADGDVAFREITARWQSAR